MKEENILSRVKECFNLDTFFNLFNFIKEKGFPKSSAHYILINFFTCIGTWSQYIGTSEVPIIDEEYALITYRTNAKSPDVIWYEKFQGIPKAIFEVQRYEKKKIRGKLDIDSFHDKILNLFIVRNDLKQKFPENYFKIYYFLIELFNQSKDYENYSNTIFCETPKDFFNKGVYDENDSIYSPITKNTEEIFVFVKILLNKDKKIKTEFLEEIKLDLFIQNGKYSKF